MKVNIENLVNQSIGCMVKDPGGYAYCLREFVENLKEVKEKHREGKSKEILDEFFRLYVFNKIDTTISHPKTVKQTDKTCKHRNYTMLTCADMTYNKCEDCGFEWKN